MLEDMVLFPEGGTGMCSEGTSGHWRTLCCFLREGDRGTGAQREPGDAGGHCPIS